MSGFVLMTGLGGLGPMERLGADAIEGITRLLPRSPAATPPCSPATGGPGTLARLVAPAKAGWDTTMPLADRTDEALMTAYTRGDHQAFPVLIERYKTELHQFLSRFLGSSAAADDVFQETFLQVHLAGHSFDAERSFKPWLFTIAANKARDWHRRQKRRATISLDAPIGGNPDSARLIDLIETDAEAPAAPAEADELKTLVAAVMSGLPVHYREILLLSYFQRMSYSQVSEVLGIPLGTVKSRLHAAVGAFADRWKAARAQRAAAADPARSHRAQEPRA